ncbi:hypothetical protein LCGC14_0542570 [marine sediment metagenome]|uniref:Uncharacterized protein n=1 Tax=marine sediment metagenome TaxID=412755 RepID=A0A0F9SAY9_9ZZZZ
MAKSYAQMLADFKKREEDSIAANQRRLDQTTAIFDEIINRYKPGGSFGRGYLSQLENQKVQDVGQESQQMISSGLYGTTTAAGAGQRWEANVGATARLKLEDVQMERLSQAQVGKAGLIERVENPAPNLDYIIALTQAQSSSSGGGGGGGTSGGQRPRSYGTSGGQRPRSWGRGGGRR